MMSKQLLNEVFEDGHVGNPDGPCFLQQSTNVSPLPWFV
jgi:hypothetical protein